MKQQGAGTKLAELHYWLPCRRFQLYSVCFAQPNITNYEFASGFTICTHTTSLTFERTSNQEKLPRNKKTLFMGEKGKKPSGEQQRRIPLLGLLVIAFPCDKFDNMRKSLFMKVSAHAAKNIKCDF